MISKEQIQKQLQEKRDFLPNSKTKANREYTKGWIHALHWVLEGEI